MRSHSLVASQFKEIPSTLTPFPSHPSPGSWGPQPGDCAQAVLWHLELSVRSSISYGPQIPGQGYQ